MRISYLILALFVAVSLTSCSGGDSKAPTTEEVVTGYTKTLSGAREKAKDVAGDLEGRLKEQDGALGELDR